MDDDYRRSEDDELEPKDDIYNPELDEQKLLNDYETPFTPANDVHSHVPIDDPSTDDQLDSDELYQEGIGGATNADDEEVDLDDEEPRPLDIADES
jgi:hypothetical protein